MFRVASENDREAILSFSRQEPHLSHFIVGDIENFGFDKDFQDVWVDVDRGELRAVLLRYHINYPLYAPGDFDVEGAARIISGHDGFWKVNGESGTVDRIIAQMKLEHVYSNLILTLSERDRIPDRDTGHVESIGLDDAREVFDLMLANLIDDEGEFPFEGFRINLETGTGRTWVVRHYGSIVSAASTVAETSSGAMIIGVVTDPGHRGRGYASDCMTVLSQTLTSEGRECILFYSNPTAGAIYRRIGYTDRGGWKIAMNMDPKRLGQM